MVTALSFSTGDSLRREGDLPAALTVLMEEAAESGGDPWVLYALAWTANRMELPEEAVSPALAAWRAEPSNPWFLAEYMRAMRAMGMYHEVLSCSVFVRGGGVCRYYLADCEMDLGSEETPSLDYLVRESSGDDSAAADACIWLSIVQLGNDDPQAALSSASRAVDLVPEDAFYRCVLAQRMAEAGSLETSRDILAGLRLEGETDLSYWQACAALSSAEGDEDRVIWALRRARECRRCPGTDRELGWALYFAGRDALREGDTELCRHRLTEAAVAGDTAEVFVQRADSLLELLNEFEKGPAGGSGRNSGPAPGGPLPGKASLARCR
ncbi:MAG: hypothetical protein AVO35_07355 [Candidatus Aegiribacteria sp. MLS_C]|nr:MAG: hypothetical protein AVO35_07355 [Candidatus Aegiribacteria sp. MLS_C]